MGRRSELVDRHTVRVGKANKSEFKVACVHCRNAGIESLFVSRTDAVVRHLAHCGAYTGPIPKLVGTNRKQAQIVYEPAAAAHGRSSNEIGDSFNGLLQLNNSSSNENKLVEVKGDDDWHSQMEKLLLRSIVSGGLSFGIVEDESFCEFLQFISPQLKANPQLIPSHENLTGRILENADQDLKRELSEELNNSQSLTLCVDCWINSADRLIMGFVLKTASRSFAWKWKEVDGDNSSTNVLRESVIDPDVVANSHGDKVDDDRFSKILIETVSDADIHDKIIGTVITQRALKYFDEINIEYVQSLKPSLLMLLCYDQEIQGLLFDCLNALPEMKGAIACCNDVTRFFSQSAAAREVLKNQQQSLGEPSFMFNKIITTDCKSSVNILKAFVECGTSIQRALYMCQADDNTFDAVLQQEMVNIQLSFGDKLNLLPYAIKLMESLIDYQDQSKNGTRLRMVLPAAFKFYTALVDIESKSGENINTSELKLLVNGRLQTWDIKLLILATIFDPNVRQTIFNKNVVNTRLLIEICEDVHLRLFGSECSTILTQSFVKYLNGEGWPFSDEKFNAFPVDWYWKPLTKNDFEELSRLGSRLESFIVGGVDADKLFKDMGSIHSVLKRTDSSNNNDLVQFLENAEPANAADAKQAFTFEDLINGLVGIH